MQAGKTSAESDSNINAKVMLIPTDCQSTYLQNATGKDARCRVWQRNASGAIAVVRNSGGGGHENQCSANIRIGASERASSTTVKSRSFPLPMPNGQGYTGLRQVWRK